MRTTVSCKRLRLVSAGLLAAVMMSGCSIGHTDAASAAAGDATTPPASLSGRAMGGQQPITGASVVLYAVNGTTSGGASTSLMTSAVTTASDGTFVLTGKYSCTGYTGAQVYLLITGGNPGGTANNPQISLMAALGACSNLHSTTYIAVTEVTTVAAVAAIGSSHISSPTAIGASGGLGTAFTLANELANTTTGTAPGTGVPGGDSVPASLINTLANILASCVNSTGGAAGDGTNCGNLFSDSSGTVPTNTIMAMVNILSSTSVNLSALFGLVDSQAPFAPSLSVPPASWAVALYTTSPVLTTTPSSYTFANTEVSATSAGQAIVLNNTGGSSITLGTIALAGANSGDFAMTGNTCSTSLAAAASCTVTVDFAPGAAGPRYGALSITTSADISPLYVPLSGTGNGPTITTTSLAGAPVNASYSATLAATGGSGSGYTWSVTSGASTLAAINLSLSSAGVITGTQTALGYASFTAKVKDSAGGVAKANFVIAVSNAQAIPSGTLTTASVAVNATSEGTIGTNFLGFSYDKTVVNTTPYALSSADTNLVNLYKLIMPTGSASNPPVLRIGGSGADTLLWNATGSGGASGFVEAPDVSAVAGFAAATGWQVIYGINLGSSTPTTSFWVNGLQQTTTLAQQEISTVASAFSTAGALAPWYEIGNECDHYKNATGQYNGVAGWSPTSTALTSFETLWSTYRSAILTAVPTAVITGPASGDNEANWTEPFAQWAGSKISLMTQHYYRFTGGSAPTAANLISYPDNLANDTTAVNTPSQALTTNTGNTGDGVTGAGDGVNGLIGNPGSCSDDSGLTCTANSIGVPWRMAESNSQNSAGTSGILGVSNGYGSALWVMDHIFTLAYGGASGVNISGVSSKASGYQPISFSSSNLTSNTSVLSVNPSYYGMLMTSMMGSGTLLDTTVNAGALNVSAYTVLTSSGGQNLLVINKDGTNNLDLTISMATAVSYARAVVLTQWTAGNTVPDITASTGVTIQGSAVSVSGGFSPGISNTCTVTGGTSVHCYVPVYSAILVQMQ